MSEKTATVHWEGRGKEGVGKISTDTEALRSYPYGFGSRFEDDRSGSNPEELIAAAHAACFTMAFSFACDQAGFATSMVDSRAHVRLMKEGEGFKISRIRLTMEARVPGISKERFQEIAEQAKHNCPVSRALAGVPEITLEALLHE